MLGGLAAWRNLGTIYLVDLRRHSCLMLISHYSLIFKTISGMRRYPSQDAFLSQSQDQSRQSQTVLGGNGNYSRQPQQTFQNDINTHQPVTSYHPLHSQEDQPPAEYSRGSNPRNAHGIRLRPVSELRESLSNHCDTHQAYILILILFQLTYIVVYSNSVSSTPSSLAVSIL